MSSAISSPKLRATPAPPALVPNVLLEDAPTLASTAAPPAPTRRRATASRRRANSVDSGSVAGPRTAVKDLLQLAAASESKSVCNFPN